MPATLHRRSGRISLRVTATQKEFIARAAALETGGDLTRFVADAALRAARAAIEEHGTSLMTVPMRRRFYELLLSPPEPTRELIALLASEAHAGFAVDD